MEQRDDLRLFFGLTLAASVAISGVSRMAGSDELALLAVISPSVIAVLLTRRNRLPLATLRGAQVTTWRPIGSALIVFPALALVATAVVTAVSGDDLFERSELVLQP